ncbi:MAG: tail fiber domain-containing protein [Flavobacteriaceae bacterium]
MFKKITLSVLTLFCFTSLLVAQVGIGTTMPDPSAMLDIESSNSGFLIPRVELIATNSQVPIAAPTLEEGLMVFNIATDGTAPNNVTPGFYYWQGPPTSRWIRINSGASTDWTMTGNAGTTPGTGVGQNYIGTSDNVNFIVGTNGTQRFNFTNNGRLRASVNGTAGQPTYSWNDDANTGIWRPAADNLAFSTGGLERMRFLTNGRVGINEIDPLALLHISSPLTGAAPAGGPGIFSEITVTDSNWSAIEAFNPNTAGGVGLTGVGAFGVRGLSNPAIINGVGVRGQGYFAIEGFGAEEGVYGQGLVGVVGVTTDLAAGWAGIFDGDVFVTGEVFATAFTPSDKRVKKNFREIDNALTTINALKPSLYEKNVSIVRNKHNEKYVQSLSLNTNNNINQRISNSNNSSDQTEYGLIAQEVELILPNLIKEKKINIEGLGEINLKSVNYTGLIPILIQGIKEQQEIIENQDSRIARLEALVNQLINEK